MYNSLIRLRDRYFRSVMAHPEGSLVHHGDCLIYRSVEVYGSAPCTCGFLHDIQHLNSSLVDKLYSSVQHSEDLKNQDGIEWASEEEQQEALNFLISVFGQPSEPDSESFDEEEQWQAIEEVFGSEFCQRRKREWRQITE